MESRVRHKQAKRFAALLLTVFLAYLCSNSLFVHIHRGEDTVILHSHFYSGTPDNPGHSHSQTQLQLIASLSKYVAIEAAEAFDFNPVLILCVVLVVASAEIISRAQAYRSWRAPPVVMKTL